MHVKPNNHKQLPISTAQKNILSEWDTTAPENSYNIFLVNKLVGKLDRSALKKACEVFVHQNEITHAQYTDNRNTCYHGGFEIDDFYRELPPDTKQAVEGQIHERLYSPFDLTKGPLLQFYLAESKVQEYYFFFVAHPVIFDTTSIHLLVKQVQENYHAISSGAHISLNNDKTFSQAVAEEKETLNDAAAKDFWNDFISDVPLNLHLPYRSGRYSRLANKSFEVVNVDLNKHQATQLKAYAKKKDTTVFDVLLALYGWVLSKYSNQKRFMLGYPVDTRAADFTNVTGRFENRWQLKFELDTINTFTDLIKTISEQRKLVKPYQNYTATSKDFNAGFGQIYLDTLKLNNLEVSPVDISLDNISTDEIRLLFDDQASDVIKLKLVYRSVLFDKDLIQRFTAALLNGLNELINREEIYFNSYTVLSKEAYHQVVYEWNATTKAYPGKKTIHQHFEEQVAKNPDYTALVYEDQQLTYRQLNEKSNQLARYIRKQYQQRTGKELTPDTLIALCLDRSLEMMVSIMAVLKAGGAYVPMDPSYPQQRIDFILENTGTALILSHRAMNENSELALPAEKVLYTDLTEHLYFSEDTANLPVHSTPQNLAYVIYTSGTTGKPKGVMIAHHQVLSFAIDNNFIDYNKATTVAGISNYAFDGSVFDIFFSLLNSKKLIIIPGRCLLDLSLLDHQFTKHHIDTTFITTALFNSLVTYKSGCLYVLKQILFGGEACSIEIVNDFKRSFGETALIHVYGPTENIVFASYCHLTDYDTTDVVPIGTHLSDKKLYILDTSLQPVPVGVIGELYIGGAGVASGYLNNRELTAARFITNPFATEEDNANGYTRLYKTGDLVKWLQDGNIEYVGRNDEQVKIRGFRIELPEIEQALLQIPGIKQSCVLVKEKSTASGTAKYLVGYYVLDPAYIPEKDAVVLDSWENFYNSSIYGKTLKEIEVSADFSGWSSHITGEAIPLSEMKRWRADIITIIKSLHPGNVLEIGVGSGLLMYPLLSEVKQYTGLDISQRVINRHQNYLKEQGYPVELYHLKAHELDQLPDDIKYDTIIANSVCQYFPGIRYFDEMLEKAMAKLSPSGAIFLGDIRNYDLHKELIKEQLDFKGEEYSQNDIDRIALKENELLISPAYFLNLKHRYENISVNVLPRNGSYHNELSKYRYDVVITREAKEAGNDSTEGAGGYAGNYFNIPFLNQLGKGDILQQLSQVLPDYMLPGSLVAMEAFPLTINGKLDKRAFPDPDFSLEEAYVPPVTDTEIALCKIWQEALGLEKVGITDDFFKIGGNSILAIHTSHSMNKVLGGEIRVTDVFKHRTIEQLLLHSQQGQAQITIPRTGEQSVILSFAQERLWFIEEYEEGTNAYHIPVVYELGDNTKIEGLKYALRQIVARHEVLRTTIQGREQQGVQVVHQKPLSIQEVLLTAQDDLEALLTEDINGPFDLRKEYPIRVKFYRVQEDDAGADHSADRTILLINIHHIASDGWSTEIFQKELFTYYQAYIKKDTAFSLPALEIQYKDYALWQRSWLTGETLNRQLSYWKHKLSGYQDLIFPTDYPRPDRINYSGAHKIFTLGKTVSDRLRALVKRHGVTLHSALLSSVHILLGKYTGQDDILTGSPIANRHHRQTQDLIGFFVNTLINRTLLSNTQSYEALILEVHQQQMEAQQHQDLPFEKLISELGVERDLSRHPLFQIAFVVQSFGSKMSDEQKAYLKPFKSILSHEVEKFDLSIFVDDSSEEITGQISYATSLFREDTITRLIEHYTHLLDALTLSPEKAYSRLGLLSPGDYRQIVYDWNATSKLYPKGKTIHQHFEEQAATHPDSIALVYEDQQLTYQQLNEKSNQLARHIREQYRQRTGAELKPDTLIALCLDRGLEMIISILAVLKAGGAYVPMDPFYPQQRIDFILEDTDAALVLSQRKNSAVHLPAEKILYTDHTEELYRSEDITNLPAYSGARNLAYIIYTSGTTGKPKGVMIEHEGVMNLVFVQQDKLALSRESKVLQYASLVFDASVWEIFSALTLGAQLAIVPGGTRQDPQLLTEYIHKSNTTTALLPPVLLSVMPAATLPGLNTLVVGGDVSTLKLMQEWSQGRTLVNAYGPTENTVIASMHVYHEGDLHTNIGKPVENTRLYVLDARLQPIPVGGIGELHIGGAGLARGYLNNAELTATRFIANPFATEEDNANGYTRLYKTGDLVRWLANGDIEYIGRNDEQVKIRGFRIELAEIEQALLQVPGIRQSCVLAKERTTTSGSTKYLVGYYVPDAADSHAASLTLPGILDALSKVLPGYMLPGHLVAMPSFPLTINGKLDKRALPDPDFSVAETYVAPATDTKIALCRIWQELLGVEKVGITDDFFKIGGNSILAIQISHRMNKALGVEIRVSDVFKYKTIAQLLLHTQGQVQLNIPRTDDPFTALSFAQERLWFIEAYEKGTNAYHIPMVYELGDATDAEGLKYALRQIVARHEILRTTIESRNRQAVQIVHQEPLTIQEELFTTQQDLEAGLEEDIKRPFDLQQEYPVRVKFYRLQAEGAVSRSTVLLVNIHHIASDGWSTDIFQKELFAYYQAYGRKDTAFSLPALEIQYRDYALWQRSWLTGETLDKQLSYWKNMLSGYQTLVLPTDYPRPDRMNYSGAYKVFSLRKEVSNRLRSLVKKHGVTMHSALLSSINILLGKYTGQDDILTGSPIANRHHRQTQDLIGFFVNTLINRTQLSNTQSYEELIREVHQQQMEAQLHQDLPFEKLVNELGVERDLSRHPLFQVAFAVQSFGGKMYDEQQAYLKPFSGTPSHEIEIFDLSVFVDDSQEEIMGQLSYATSLFREDTIDRLLQHYIHLLDTLTQAPEKAYSGFGLLLPAEHRQIVYEWNATDKVYPTGKTIHQYFEEQAAIQPDSIALVYEDQQLTYQQLNEKSNQLARYIRKQYQQRTGAELKPDTLIALCLDKSLEMIVSILAVLKVGGAYVPIDPFYPQQRIDFILEDTAAALVLSQRESNAGHLPIDKVLYTGLTEELYSSEDITNLPAYSAAQNLAYIIYTSGTTGAPKGVMIAHEGVMNLVFVQQDKLDLNSSSNVLQYASLVFDASVWEIFSALTLGAQLSIVPANMRQDAQLLSAYIARHKATTALLPPVLLSVMTPAALQGLKTLVVGGDVSTLKLMQDWSRERKLVNAYGPTENSVIASMHTYKEGDLHTNIGNPIENTRLYVLDAGLQPVPVGVIGELHIGGVGLAKGYLNNADLTAARFITNPFATEEDNANGYTRLYKTGDLVRWLRDGSIEYIGRNDEQVKIRGFRIELPEIEQALLQVPGIKQSCVLVKERSTASGSAKYLVGYYIPDTANPHAAKLTHDLILDRLSEKLPGYMVPDSLVAMESFPLTINGKLDKRALPDPDFNVAETYIPPANELENKLCHIYAAVLGLDSEQISTHQNFFKIGGNSILSIQLKNQLNELEEFKHIGAADLFKHNTIHKLIESIRKDVKTAYKLQGNTQGESHEIAIIAASGAFSGVNNVEELWQVISGQQEGIRFYSKDECRALRLDEVLLEHPDFVPVAGHVKDIELFDPMFWELSPNEAKQLDPQIRKFIEHSWFALEFSGYVRERRAHNIGVFAGSGESAYLQDRVLQGDASAQADAWEAFAANSKHALVTKTAYLLDLTGPANAINTACSTGLVAVVEACQKLQLGICDMALAGGVSLGMPDQVGYLYREGMIQSRDGHCRTFDQDANGTTSGSGVGVVLLKRLKDAVKDGDHILGVIKGYATNNDGARKTGYTAPSVIGQTECIINAQKMAGITPDQIDYVECHGTATQLGDPIEVQALKEAFAYNQTVKKDPARKTVLGAVKANIGHTDAAAGTAGLIKVCAMLEHNLMPGQVNFNAPNAELKLEETDFEIIKENRPWLPVPGKQRLAGVSSFGIGGTNAHVIVGDYIPDTPAQETGIAPGDETGYIIPVSAKNRPSLDNYKQALIKTLEAHPTLKIRDIAYTLQEKREHFIHRSTFYVKNIPELLEKLKQDKAYGQAAAEAGNKLVFMFSGQGVQYINMAKTLYQNVPAFKNTVDHCISLANQHLEVNLYQVIYAGGEHLPYNINETRYTQISLFIIEYALAAYLEQLDIKADAYIGHSIGEYVAATLAGVFTLEDAIKVVIARGRLMQSMEAGSMLAISAREETVKAIIAQYNCEIAVINSPEDIVASGEIKDIDRLHHALEQQGISTVRLNTSHAFHCKLMDGAAAAFEAIFKDVPLNKPNRIFISNLSGEIAKEEVTHAEYWCKQLRNTVQFAKGIETISRQYNHKVNFVEIGAGKGLCYFVGKYKNTWPSVNTLYILPAAKEAEDAYQHVDSREHIIAKLWMNGIIQQPNDSKIFSQARVLRHLPVYQFNYQKCWLEKGNVQPVQQFNSIEDLFYERTWERRKINATPEDIGGKHILVLINDRNIATTGTEELLQLLMRHNNRISYVIHQQENNIKPEVAFDFTNPAHVTAIFNEKTRRHPLDLVIYISPGIDPAYPALDIIAIRNVFNWSIDTGNEIPKFVSISFDNYEILGTERRQEKPSIVYGVTKSISAEYFTSELNAFHLDLSAKEEHYEDSLLPALAKNDDQELMVLRGKYCWTPTFRHIKLPGNRIRPEDNKASVFLITGGLGALGYAYAHHLTQNETQRTIILLGRTPEPNLRADYKDRLHHLRNTKHHIIYSATDIGQTAAFSHLATLLESNGIGGIDVVLHTAGVAAKSILDTKTSEDIERVVNPKIIGFENILKLAAVVPIDKLVCCSSLSSMLSHAGNMEYTAANLYLDEVSFRSHPNVNSILTINLNQIADAGMAVDFIKEGVNRIGTSPNSIKSYEFPGILEKLLLFREKTNIILSRYNFDGSYASVVSPAGSRHETAVDRNDTRIVDEDYNELQYQVAQIFGEVLGLEQVSIHDDFFKIGGNSILVIQLKNKLNQLLEFKHIGTADLFKYSSIHQLVASVRQDATTTYNLQSNTGQGDSREIAVIAASGAFSGVNNVEELWQIISSQQEGIRFYSKDECRELQVDEAMLEHPDFVPVAGQVKDIGLFDPMFWELSPNEAKQLDPQIRKFIEHCWFALESSGYSTERKKYSIGVFAGAGENTYLTEHVLAGEVSGQVASWEAMVSNSKHALATKTAYLLNLSGPANSINTACSTSLVTIAEACKSLQLGVCDMALAGGVTLDLPDQVGYVYQEGMTHSRDGHCRTFDQKAGGTTTGSGVGVVLLKRLKDAVADQDLILGVIKGYATNNDGSRKTSYTAPSVVGQTECIINAQKMAGITSDQVDYVECHGTATHLGDPIEVRALREAFAYSQSAEKDPARKTVLGAIKANIGHPDAAAGVAGLIKVCAMLQHHIIPGQVNFNAPNTELQLEETSFEVLKENRPWSTIPGRQRLAGVSSFGVGGTNAHVIIGEYIPDMPTQEPRLLPDEEATYIVPVSAKSRQSLENYKQALAKVCEDNPGLKIRDIAYTLQEKRERFSHRSAYCVNNTAELVNRLKQDTSYGQAGPVGENRLVLMFPGQGVQYVNMAKALYQHVPAFKNTVDRCIALANQHLQVDLYEVIYGEGESPACNINEMQWAPISLFIIEYSLASYLDELGIKADAYIGHSLGEYVAATLAGVFKLEDAIKLVVARGRLMHAMDAGGMLAINAREEAVKHIIAKHNCDIAVVNTADDVMAAGRAEDVDRLQHALEQQELPVIRISINVAGHSRMMEATAAKFKTLFTDIKLGKPTKPFISNLTGEIATDEVATPEYWCQQLRNTVKFAKGIDTLSKQYGHKVSFIEIGPGKGLSYFVGKYRDAGNYQSLTTLHLLPSAKESNDAYLNMDSTENLLARLWMNGIIQQPNESHVFKQATLLRALPVYQFNHQQYWIEKGKAKAKGNAATEELQLLPKEKSLSAPVWSAVSGLNKGRKVEKKFKHTLVFLREEQLSLYDFTLLSEQVQLVVLGKNDADAAHFEAGKLILLNPKVEQHFEKLAAYIKAQRIVFDTIIHAASIDNVAEIDQALYNSYYSLFLIRHHVLRVTDVDNLVILTNGLSQITGEDRINAANGTLVGAIRNINHEFLTMDGRIIDVGNTTHLPAVVAQIWHNSHYYKSEEPLAARFGKLWIQRLESIEDSFAEENYIEDGDVILITGGLGNVGLAVAEHLSVSYQVKFILVSRTDIYKSKEPSDTTKRKIAAIERIRKNGSIVEVAAADVSSPEQVKALLEAVHRQHGPVTGVIHTASGTIVNLDDYNLANMKASFKAKVYGIDNVLNHIDLDHLKFVTSTSSLASIMGDVNRIEYCASNAYLDYLSVDKKRLPGIKIMTTNWNAWQSDTSEITQLYNQHDHINPVKDLEKLMYSNGASHEENAALFCRLLNQSSYEQIAISRLDLQQLKNELFKPVESLQVISQVDILEKVYTPAEYQVALIFAELLGLEQISLQDDFFKIGGNSILAIQASHRMNKTLGIEIKVADIFKHRCIAQLMIHSLAKKEERINIPRTGNLQAALSFAQERLWFIEAYEEGTNAYHIPTVYELADTTGVEGIKYALRQIVSRHEVLRSTIEGKEQQAVQIVHSEPLLTEEVLLTAQDDLEALLAADMNRPFDLRKDYPIRVVFYRIPAEGSGAERVVLLVNIHHIASDGWSMDVFQRELFAYYQAYAQKNMAFSLPDLEIQYKDYALWQRSWLTGETLARQLNYWKDRLSGYQTLLLPTDYPRPERIDYTGAHKVFSLSKEVSNRLRAVAKQHGTTLYSALLSGFNILLGKYTGQDDILVGGPIANRHHQQTQDLIGFFVNTLISRTLLSNTQSYEELIRQVHQQQMDAQQHQDLPFEKLVNELGVERDLSRHPIFQVAFVVQSFGSNGSNEQKTYLKPFEGQFSHEVEKFDLSIFIDDNSEEIIGQICYATSLFREETISRMIRHYIHLLDALTQSPGKAYSSFSLLLPEEFREIVYDRNAAAKGYRGDITIHRHFEAQVAANPDHIALVHENGQWSYRKLNEKSNQLARYIRAQYRERTGQELTRDKFIALCLERSPEMIISILAVLKAGGAYVPIDPFYPRQRIDFMLEDTGAALILSHGLTADLFLPADKVLFTDLTEALYDHEDPANLPAYSASDDLAYIIYTSGTTGNPKGVMIAHQQVLSFAIDNNFIDYDKATTLAGVSNYAFDGSIFDIFFSLLNSKKLVLIPRRCLLDLSLLDQQFIEHKIDTTFFTTTLFNSLVAHKAGCLGVLKQIFFGGEAGSREIVKDFKQHYPATAFTNVYGPTENIVFSSYCHLADYDTTAVLPIGTHLSDKKLYILDEALQPVPVGVIGELYIGGAGVGRGYLNNPELTAARFMTNPFATGEDNANGHTRIYKTGDLVKWLDDGNIAYIGRNDEQVKIRGFRIELPEIEKAIGQIPGILQSCVLVKERPAASGTTKYLVGYYVPEKSGIHTASLTPDLILDMLAKTLPDYMLPGSLIAMESFPMTINGKLDRRALPDPDFKTPDDYTAPVTDTEILLCNIWQEVLGLEKVGTTHDFFKIGGNSILAIQVSHRMSNALGAEIKVADVFMSRNISQLLGNVTLLAVNEENIEKEF